jgi:hypothetical protein
MNSNKIEEFVTHFPVLAKDFTFLSLSISSNFCKRAGDGGLSVIVDGGTIFSFETKIE